MKLFLGLIFLLLDIKITVGTAVIGLLPDFIGCGLMMKALEEKNDPRRHLAFGLMLGSLVLFLADLVDKPAGAQAGFWCAALAAEALGLLLIHGAVRREKRLRTLFPAVAGLRLVCCCLSWMPLVGTVCAVAGNLVSVCFLAAAYGLLVKGK